MALEQAWNFLKEEFNMKRIAELEQRLLGKDLDEEGWPRTLTEEEMVELESSPSSPGFQEALFDYVKELREMRARWGMTTADDVTDEQILEWGRGQDRPNDAGRDQEDQYDPENPTEGQKSFIARAKQNLDEENAARDNE